MTELGVAFGLVLILEGLCYALFPDVMRKTIYEILSLPKDKLRLIGIIASLIGLTIVWFFKR